LTLFRCPTIGFDLLYAFRHFSARRRDLVWINGQQQIRRQIGCTSNNEPFPWDEAARANALIRDRDRDLWARRHPPIALHGHPGRTHRIHLALQNELPNRLIVPSRRDV